MNIFLSSYILGEVRTYAVTLKLRKCRFAQREVVYVSYLIGNGRHRPDPKKIKAVAESDRPLIKRQLEQRLGLLSYYRSYVPYYATIAKPLTALTGKREPSLLKWGKGTTGL